MAEIKRLASKYLSDEQIKEILSGACSYCKIIGDNTPWILPWKKFVKK
ncbi:MAG: hypothetical protein ACR2IS_04415 [Nitrososphaeraceae archaeon]